MTFFPNNSSSDIPLSYRPKITQREISQGYVTRYFVQNISISKNIVEINKTQYEQFRRNPYYRAIQFDWIITGNAYDIISPNGKVVTGAATQNSVTTEWYNQSISGLRRHLQNPLEFFVGKLNKQVTGYTPEPITNLPNFSSSHAIITRTTTTTTTTVAPLESTREYQNEFAISQFFESSSITLRPDAVSFDYKTAFTLGPIAFGSGSLGLFDKIWRFRADDQNNIWYSVEQGEGWSNEQLLFSFVGEPVIEIDAAFEQQGRSNVIVQRNTGTNGIPQTWLYWFDPILSNFTFQNLGNGRTPRISLDNWLDPTDSDILVFYVNDTANRIQYKVQRDRFNIIYNTPIVSSQNTYLERVAFGIDFRYRVTYSERNTTLGTYELKQLASSLYPIPISESFTVSGSFISLDIKNFPVYSSSLFDPESYSVSGSVVSVDIKAFTVLSSSIEPESYTVSGSFISLDIKNFPVYSSSLFDPESYAVTGSIINVQVKEILITSSLDVEPYFVTGSVVSVTVAVP